MSDVSDYFLKIELSENIRANTSISERALIITDFANGESRGYLSLASFMRKTAQIERIGIFSSLRKQMIAEPSTKVAEVAPRSRRSFRESAAGCKLAEGSKPPARCEITRRVPPAGPNLSATISNLF